MHTHTAQSVVKFNRTVLQIMIDGFIMNIKRAPWKDYVDMSLRCSWRPEYLRNYHHHLFHGRLKVASMIRNHWLVLANGRLGGWSKMAPKEVTTTTAHIPAFLYITTRNSLIQMTFNTWGDSILQHSVAGHKANSFSARERMSPLYQ